MRRRLAALVGAVLVAACAGPQDAAVPPSEVASAASASVLDLSAATVDGGQIDAGSLEGRDVVLWFWAPW